MFQNNKPLACQSESDAKINLARKAKNLHCANDCTDCYIKESLLFGWTQVEVSVEDGGEVSDMFCKKKNMFSQSWLAVKFFKEFPHNLSCFHAKLRILTNFTWLFIKQKGQEVLAF